MGTIETLFADGFDKAIIGLTDIGHEPKVVYDKDLMIATLMENDEMEYIDAIEFLSFNTWGAYVGIGTPIYVDEIEGKYISHNEMEEPEDAKGITFVGMGRKEIEHYLGN